MPLPALERIAGSEVGIVDIPVERIEERGKLGPGDLFAVDTVKGRILKNAEVSSATCVCGTCVISICALWYQWRASVRSHSPHT